MATAIEYGLIAAGISLAIVTATNGLSVGTPRWNGSADKQVAAEACKARPGAKSVVIKDWLQKDAEYECSDWPNIFNPTFRRYR